MREGGRDRGMLAVSYLSREAGWVSGLKAIKSSLSFALGSENKGSAKERR